MLVNVNVKNLALIQKVDIFFDEGLNIMTGETGAGKSIIIGSVLIALGGKVPKDIVRDETKEALVELVFQVQNEKLKEELLKYDVRPDEENNVIISRKILNGRSTSKVNGETFTTTNLKKVTELLIDIHGQHDHQSLLKNAKQLEILDEFSGTDVLDLKEKIKQEYKIYTNLKHEFQEFDINDEERNREIAFCRYEIEEIENAHLSVGEYDDTENLYKKMSFSKTILEKMNEIYELIGEDSFDSVSEKISNAYRISQSACELDEDINEITNSLADMESICEDIKRAIKSYVDSMSFDEQQAKELEERMDELNRLRQKYEVEKKQEDPILNILAYKEKQEEKLFQLENLEARKNEILEKLNISENNLTALSDELTTMRKQNGAEFGKRIVEVLNGLNFLDARFDIQFTQIDSFSANGRDEIEFMLSTNPGEPVRPLKDIASGGELSRIMLGIKTIMASKDEIETLIFDEIDTGISGRTAQMVADRLKEISRLHQIICITHLPQIAAMANQHYVIEKNVINGNTETNIRLLDEKDSVEELARMLGGVQITDAVRENARELKRLANN